ncbi:GMC oxidoreductase [Caulobacter sp. LARHSG274]
MIGSINDLGLNSDYDVCIVGGGAAGLTIAADLMGKGLKILVLEAGTGKSNKQIQQAYQGEIVDPALHPKIDQYRVRALGGTSRIWGGRAIPLDAIDFEKRDWLPHSGWPIDRGTLEPYYPAALLAAEAGAHAHDPASALPGRPDALVRGLQAKDIATTIERFSRPTNFWERYGPALSAASDTHVASRAAVVSIRLTPDGKSVDHLTVAGPDGKIHEVRARSYVIAMGGLETTRLLMASNDVAPHGIGGGSGQLGRYYMSHLCATASTATFSGPPSDVAWDYEQDAAGIYLRRRLWITEAAQRSRHILNTTFRTHLPDVGDPDHGDPILSAMFLVKDMVLYEYARKFSDRQVSWSDRGRHVMNIVTNPVRLARFGWNWVQKRNLASRKLPSVVLGSPQNRYPMEFHAEQAPNPDSRLTLMDGKDALGMPRLKVDWRTSALDIESLERAHAVLAATLEASGTGRLMFDPQSLEVKAKTGIVGGHHLGTTRMSADPRDGVVDADCKVHGVDNLFIASGSVFPTSGQANPTLTILALALRLSDHLQSALKMRSSLMVLDRG